MFPVNWEALNLFLALDSQWRFTAAGRPAGIDFTSLQAAMSMLGIVDQPTMFRRIKRMEEAALTEWRERSK